MEPINSTMNIANIQEQHRPIMSSMNNPINVVNYTLDTNMYNNGCTTREEMLQEIRCCKFAITDMGLYLDTHPQDQRALCLHREYCNKCRCLTDNYQKMYGPLSIECPCNKWRWIEEPWGGFRLGVKLSIY